MVIESTEQFLARVERLAKECAIKDGRTTREPDIRCPHCGEEQTNDEGQFSNPDSYDEWTDHECANCEKPFQATWEACYSTRKDSQ